MNFIFNGHVYDKPMFSIVAYNEAQLPTAFEQMEKLRKSGHLTGYVRREAFLPGELNAGLDLEKEQPAALLKFTLYRLQKDASALPHTDHPDWHFCPSRDRDLASGHAAVRTNCLSSFIYESLAPDFACSACYKDSFEDMVFCGRESISLPADDTTPVRELLERALGENGMLMGHFSAKGITLCPSELALHRRASAPCYEVLTREADKERVLASLCQPKNGSLCATTRLEGGRALFLGEHLARLKALAYEHAICAEQVEAMARSVSTVDQPLPGSQALWEGGVPCPWAMLPPAVEEAFGKAGMDVQAKAVLTLRLCLDGALELQVTPLEEMQTVRCGVARTCLDERSDAWQLDDSACLQAQDPVFAAVRDGSLDDAIVVNRCAVVTGTGLGGLLCKQGPGVHCVPVQESARDNVALDFLKNRGLVQEKLFSLAQTLSSETLYRIDSVHGMTPVTLCVQK